MANQLPSGPMLFSLLATRPARKTFEKVAHEKIDYYDGAQGAISDGQTESQTEPLSNTSNSIFMTQCQHCEFTFRRLTNLVLERCHDVTVHVDAVIASCELIHCQRCTIIVHRRAGTLTLDHCDDVTVAYRPQPETPLTLGTIQAMTTSPLTLYTTRPSCRNITLELPQPPSLPTNSDGEDGDAASTVVTLSQRHVVVAAGEEEEGLPPCRWVTTWVQGQVKSLPCNQYGDTVEDAPPSNTDQPDH